MKKTMMIFCIFFIVIALLVSGLFFIRLREPKEPINATAKLNAESYHIGDEIILSIEVLCYKGYQPESFFITFPEKFEILRQNEDKLAGGIGFSRTVAKYYLTSFETGTFELKDLSLTYTGPDGKKQELKLQAPVIKIESLLSAESKDIRDLKPLLKAPLNPLVYFILAALFLSILIAYYIYRLKKRRIKLIKTTSEEPLPAHVIAYRKLRELELSDLIENGKIEPYFTILSQIVREYIENRFGVKAQEMTTQEFLTHALKKLQLKSEHQYLLSEFMCLSDLVKYARHVPPYEKIHQAFHLARQFVDESKEISTVKEGGEVHVQSVL